MLPSPERVEWTLVVNIQNALGEGQLVAKDKDERRAFTRGKEKDWRSWEQRSREVPRLGFSKKYSSRQDPRIPVSDPAPGQTIEHSVLTRGRHCLNGLHSDFGWYCHFISVP